MANYQYFCNKECEYYPCHPIAEGEDFNCLFCFCPLYGLGEACGGDFTILQNGVKDCTNCMYPHKKEHYAEIMRKLADQ